MDRRLTEGVVCVCVKKASKEVLLLVNDHDDSMHGNSRECAVRGLRTSHLEVDRPTHGDDDKNRVWNASEKGGLEFGK